MTRIYQSLNVVVQVRLMKPSDQVCLPWRDAQIDQLVANECILEVDDEPLPKAVQHYFIEIFVFDLPVSVHPRSELVPFRLWDVDG